MKQSYEDLQMEIDRITRELKNINAELIFKNDVLENSLNGFDIVDTNGKLVYANKTYIKMWGYSNLEEIIGMSAAEHCLDPQTPLHIINSIKKTGECSIEFKALRKDGSTFDVQMWARQAFDINGVEFYPTTSIDISEQKNAEIKQRNAILARDEFLSIASHELKTPLSSMKLKNQLFIRKMKEYQKPLTEDDVLGLLENNDKFVNRMTRLIDDMLDISRLNTGKFSIHKKKENLALILRTVISDFEDKFEEQGVELKVEKIEDTICDIDGLRLEQVFDNLFSNALKYGNHKPVTINLFKKANFAILTIKDEGIGISQEDHERIFRRYERAISANEVSGLALGLYISKRIVEMHDGLLEVSSAPSEGSLFTVRIPL